MFLAPFKHYKIRSRTQRPAQRSKLRAFLRSVLNVIHWIAVFQPKSFRAREVYRREQTPVGFRPSN